MDKKDIVKAQNYLLKSSYPIVLSGAGISADSGIPTFRSDSKLNNNFTKPIYFGHYKYFMKNPKKWWKDQLDFSSNPGRTKFRHAVENAKPNKGHYALTKMQKNNYVKNIITQNVDELHTRSGSKNVLEIHGSRYKCRCIKCDLRFPRESISFKILPPICECGGIIKYDTVLFGEQIPKKILEDCVKIINKADLILVIGTSTLVNPAASFPLHIKKNGGIIIEANTMPTPISKIADVVLRGSTSETLPELSNFNNIH
tara:strand:- start:43 stop:813 length:771 start_codon:yes stop_codon:yes gene_type:complete